MPPNIYNVYGQAGVGRDLLDSLLEADKYKDVYSKGMQHTSIEGKKLLKKEMEEAQRQMEKEAKGPFDK